MFYHFRKGMSDNDLDFGKFTEDRYVAYHKALGNKTGSGPMYWFGKRATQFVLNKKDVDPKILILSSMMFAELMTNIAEIVKNFVNSKDCLKN